MQKILFILVITFLLNSCASHSQFDCPLKPGIRCESIDSVNARVDRGEIGNNTATLIPSSANIKPISYQRPSYFNGTPFKKGEPLRYGETVMRVWVAPFEDKEGNYHQASDIYTITKPGAWMGAPLHTVDEDEE